jgi:SAM-dependent methyltransferase
LAVTGTTRIGGRFGDTAENCAVGMATSLRSAAVAVVHRAQLQGWERILDAGARKVIGAPAALLSERDAIGVDLTPGMLAIAGGQVHDAQSLDAESAALTFPDSWFNVVISVHTLQIAADPAAVLAEWRRVTSSGGRLSLSVPGPRSQLAMRIYDPIYRRYGMRRQVQVPTTGRLSDWASAAGWQEREIFADPDTVIRLAGPNSFRSWMRTCSWPNTDALSRERAEALELELLAATPIGADGQLHIPFGTLYLTARNPSRRARSARPTAVAQRRRGS